MKAGVSLLVSDMMPIYMIITLDIVIIIRVSISCSTVICLPTIWFLSREKPLVKTIAPRCIFIILISDLQNLKPKNTLLQFIYFYLILHFYLSFIPISISSLQVTMKGLTTPLSRWVQVFVCLCRCNHWWLVCSSYWIDTLVLNWGKYLSLLCYITLSSSREKPTQAQEVAGRISGTVAGEDLHQAYQVPIINSHLLHLHYSTFASCFPLPHF